MAIPMNDSSHEKLSNALDSATHEYKHLSSKASIVQYYKDNYPVRGHNGWKQTLARKMEEITGIKSKNIEKRLDPQRLNNPEPRNKAQWEQLGLTLPPVRVPKFVRGMRAQVTISMYIKISEKWVKKNFTRTLNKERTAELMEAGGVDAIIEEYGINPSSVEDVDIGNINVGFI